MKKLIMTTLFLFVSVVDASYKNKISSDVTAYASKHSNQLSEAENWKAAQVAKVNNLKEAHPKDAPVESNVIKYNKTHTAVDDLAKDLAPELDFPMLGKKEKIILDRGTPLAENALAEKYSDNAQTEETDFTVD